MDLIDWIRMIVTLVCLGSTVSLWWVNRQLLKLIQLQTHVMENNSKATLTALTRTRTAMEEFGGTHD